MITVDLVVVKQVVSKVLYEAINVPSKPFMGCLGKICLLQRIMHCTAPHLMSKWVRVNTGLLCFAFVGPLFTEAMERQTPEQHLCSVAPKSGSAGCQCRELLSENTWDPSSVRWCQGRISNRQEQGRLLLDQLGIE